MSSSPSRAPVSWPADPSPVQGDGLNVLPFLYREVAAGGFHPNLPAPSPSLEITAPDAAAVNPDPAREAQLREACRQQGAAEARAKFEEHLSAERAGVLRALADFARDRTAYYRKVEAEAVQLALAIARKVIHREAQVDPLLLMGIVRVALERIEGATAVTLLVHPQQSAEWRKFLASSLEARALPEVVEDPALAPRQCQLRTSMGTAELGLEVQLKEIEKGLMDLLAARPGEKS